MTYVYVMKSESGLVKIGVSRNVQARLKALQAASGHAIKLIRAFGPFSNAVSVERAAHRMLVHKRECGEWFSVTVDEALAAVSMAEGKVSCKAEAPVGTSEYYSEITAAERHAACLDSEEEVIKTAHLLKASGMGGMADKLLAIKKAMSLTTRDYMHACQMALMQKRIDDMVSLMDGKAA